MPNNNNNQVLYLIFNFLNLSVKNEEQRILLLRGGKSVIHQVTNVKGLELTAGPWVYDSHVKRSVKEKSDRQQASQRTHGRYD